MSLRHPPAGFPAHLAVIWPLIWVQILALRAYVRATFGKGTQYHWSVTPYGRVFITSIDWVPGQTEAPDWLKPASHSNARIAAALDGRAFKPAYAHTFLTCAHPGERRDPEAAGTARAALDPGFRRGERQSLNLRWSAGLPLPDV